MRAILRIFLLALLAGAMAPASAAGRGGKTEGDGIPATRIRDLHYGDVLFQYYVEEDFEALTRLEAYSHWKLLPNHRSEADLLAGGLYLQLGMHNEAGRRFEALTAEQLPESVRGRAFFYLGKVWYARGYYERAVESLQRVGEALAPAMEAEKRHLLANALMHLSRYDEAVDLLRNWNTKSSWIQYARFNLGVALLRSNRLADGAPFLDAVGKADTQNVELLALKDKANLALGYAYLQDKQAAAAMPYLERVRLEGPQSSRALLGLGWAHAELGHYQEALTPWLALHDRNLLDAAVQEAYLAVPYAFAHLGANGQAADYYEQALSSFAAETGRIDESVARIREGSLLKDLVGADDAKSPQRGWFWQLQELPDAPESRYLYPVLAGNDFQEGLKNFRDLAFLGSTLARWDENMVVYSDMIDARERAYATRIPRVDALLARDAPALLDARRRAAEGRFNEVVNSSDVAALGTPEQRAQWRRIEAIEAAIAADPGNEELAAMRDKLRLVRGVLQWDLTRSFPDHLYQQRRELRSLDRALDESAARWLRLQHAREVAPTTTGDFAMRIAALQERMTHLRAGLAKAADGQRQLLADIAISELDAQKQRIADYEVQARFALATIYDRASEAAPAEAVPAEAVP